MADEQSVSKKNNDQNQNVVASETQKKLNKLEEDNEILRKEALHLLVKINKLEQDNDRLKNDYDNLKSASSVPSENIEQAGKLKQCQEENARLQKAYDSIRYNITVLQNASKAEADRKDDMISVLKKELEEMKQRPETNDQGVNTEVEVSKSTFSGDSKTVNGNQSDKTRRRSKVARKIDFSSTEEVSITPSGSVPSLNEDESKKMKTEKKLPEVSSRSLRPRIKNDEELSDKVLATKLRVRKSPVGKVDKMSRVIKSTPSKVVATKSRVKNSTPSEVAKKSRVKKSTPSEVVANGSVVINLKPDKVAATVKSSGKNSMPSKLVATKSRVKKSTPSEAVGNGSVVINLKPDKVPVTIKSRVKNSTRIVASLASVVKSTPDKIAAKGVSRKKSAPDVSATKSRSKNSALNKVNGGKSSVKESTPIKSGKRKLEKNLEQEDGKPKRSNKRKRN